MTLKKDIIAILVGLIIFVMAFGSFYTVKIKAPDHAIVYIDIQKKIYYPPPYVDYHNKQNPAQPITGQLGAVTLQEARQMQFSPYPPEKEKEYFVQRYRSFSSLLLERVGLRKPLPVRWDPEGAWKW